MRLKFIIYRNLINVIAGNLTNKDDILKQQEILEQAEELGRKLS